MTRHYLFNDGELSDVLRGREQRMLAAIDEINGDEFLNTSPEDLAEYFISEYTIAVPVLDEDGITVDQAEAKVDVSGDYGRAIFDRGNR
jgi:hypothetical protein